MQSLIKWPGGKTSEFEIIKQYIPEYKRYIEPFFGGGAVFFNLLPQSAIINDISSNLMQLYRYVKSNDNVFKQCLYAINDEWELLKQHASKKAEYLCEQFKVYRENNEYKLVLDNELKHACEEITETIAANSLIVINQTLFNQELYRMVKDKVFRTRQNEIKLKKTLTDNDLLNNILTGFTSGYYMYLRSMLNYIERNKKIIISLECQIAIFYFVREFCYGSMFRYNKNGDFNIPYGGIAYNNKDFKKKIDLLFAEETRSYFTKTEIYDCDFEQILDLAQEGDFIFLDPPYDTDFSDYENRKFDENDQRRLAQRLHDTKAKFLLIIKNTPLISSLYQNNGYRVYAFDNKYSYCVKGRNDRNAVHLIVTNYD